MLSLQFTISVVASPASLDADDLHEHSHLLGAEKKLEAWAAPCGFDCLEPSADCVPLAGAWGPPPIAMTRPKQAVRRARLDASTRMRRHTCAEDRRSTAGYDLWKKQGNCAQES